MNQPMLARTYDPEKPYKHLSPEELIFVQPKLDGVRCLAHITKAEITLSSRSGKPIHAPLIKAALNHLRTSYSGITLDGELYIHGRPFQEIQGIVSKQSAHPDEKHLKYHVYDFIPGGNEPFGDRINFLYHLHKIMQWGYVGAYRKHLQLVQTTKTTAEFADDYLDLFVKDGYEGIMLRTDTPYIHGRSSGLLKYKRWYDEEYEVVNIKQGLGKNAGTAILILGIKNAKGDIIDTFKATAPGNYIDKAKVWQFRANYIGAIVTIKYQEKTKAGVPRFPIALHFRDPEL